MKKKLPDVKIVECRLEYLCARDWDDLEQTSVSNVRQCNECKESVTLCADLDELEALRRLGKCAAIDVNSEKSIRRLVGIPGNSRRNVSKLLDQL